MKPPYAQKFSRTESSETLKCSSTNVFACVKQNNSDEKMRNYLTPPAYSFLFSILDVFANTKVIPFEVSRLCETTNIQRKNVILPPSPLIHEAFRY